MSTSPGKSADTGGRRVRIYQLFVRHFGNTREDRVPDGSIGENGCGKFADIDGTALDEIRALGITHLWLTGVLEQASGTGYPHRPADDPAILKGKAGSPYAIRDYFDVCPDYAVDPERRLEEFADLLSRCRRHGLVPLIDLVPNHVARSYESDILPALTFGRGDDRESFFARDNNFFYLRPTDHGAGPPLRLPGQRNEVYEPEELHGRVTGNNCVSWLPSLGDWYETVKLNYGHDFTIGRETSHLPGPDATEDEVPDTWCKLNAILTFWQELGVGGFRVDMAHMVPLEFWRWAVRLARRRHPDVFFMAEAYDGDPAKLTDGDVLAGLLEAGFDCVYDHPSYQILQGIYEGPKWANDLGELNLENGTPGFLRYGENHDEVRIANPHRWGGHGPAIGPGVCAVQFALGQGPVMIYNGQEVGEPAEGAEGFSGDDGRSSIFDYGALPELQKWVNDGNFNGGRLSPEQKALRDQYGRLLAVCDQAAFRNGGYYGLNHANLENPEFGRIEGETASGHWCVAFVRSEQKLGGQSIVVVVNLHPSESIEGLSLLIPTDALAWMECSYGTLTFRDLLDSRWEGEAKAPTLPRLGLLLPKIGPGKALYLEVT